MTALWITGGVVLALLLILALFSYFTAVRLDRLHIRSGLAEAALLEALGRRCVLARSVGNAVLQKQTDQASTGVDQPPEEATVLARQLVTAAEQADQAPWAQRPACENEVSRLLDKLPASAWDSHHIVEWEDCQARLRIARKFNNDAIRDARTLRQQPLVKYLKLAGTAAMPQYFDFAEGGERPPKIMAQE